MTTTIRTTSTDHLAEAAHRLANIAGDGTAILHRGIWTITVPHQQRRITITNIDGEWNAGIEIYVLNRSGVVMAKATIQIMGTSPRFIAETAASLNREIR